MSLDLFLRAETPAALRTVVRSVPFRNIIGDLRERDDDDNIVSGIRMLPGSVDWVFFPSGDVVIAPPAVTDSWVWLHLRLIGAAEANDLDGMDNQTDRWGRSKIRKWMKENGTLKTIRGVKVYEHTLGDGMLVQIWRGMEMAAQGVLFHEFQGGNEY